VQDKQRITHEWWDLHRVHYELVTSTAVREECSRGDATWAEKRLAVLENVVLIDPESSMPLANAIMAKVAIPEKAAYDAVHIAVASTYNIDYILTWNFKHLANASLWPTIRKICSEFNLVMPSICSPEQLMGAVL
jgi:predicted nucleic acid-binding protein